MCYVQGFFHVGVTVSDMEQSVIFYRDGLGLEFDWEKEGDQDHIRELIGLDFTSLKNVFMKIPWRRRGRTARSTEASSASPLRLDHVTPVRVTCVSTWTTLKPPPRSAQVWWPQSFRERGHEPRCATKGMKVIYITDPDGFIVELLQRPAEPVE